MDTFLMFQNKNFDINQKLCFGIEVLTDDLELKRVLAHMAQGDKVILDTCTSALFCPLLRLEDIKYRQNNLRDALKNPDAVKQLYGITVETEKRKRSSWHWLSSRSLSGTFSSAIELLKIYTEMLMQLRLVADNNLSSFQSDGFRNLLSMLQKELDDDYFSTVRAQLSSLKDSSGMLISASLGNYLQGVGYVLRQKKRKGFWRRWLLAPSYTIAPRDDSGATDLARRRERAINEAAIALAQSAEHLEGFFAMLRKELAFYVGCLNLADKLKVLGMPICIPELLPSESKARSFNGLYDISLALAKNSAVVGNELDVSGKRLYIITGANQGGKSTFLRSIGQAQLMAQSGMFVGVDNITIPLRHGLFTHFKKEEDSALKSGKLDEELARMSEIADHLKKNSLILFNESFAATNEREGSEVARQVTQALIEKGMEVFSVTHLYTFTIMFKNKTYTQYLRAQRMNNEERSFKILPGEPLQTAFGEDLYRKIFDQNEKVE